MYRKLVSIAHPVEPRLGLDRARPRASWPARWRWRQRGTSSRPGSRTPNIKGKVGYARLPRGPKRTREHVRRHRDRHQRRRPGARSRRRPGCSSLWATSKDTQLANLKSKVGGGTPTRDSVYELPEVEKARKPPSKMPNILTDGRRVRGLEAREHRPAPEDRRLERVRHDDLHAALEDARRPAGPREVHEQHQGGLREGDREREDVAAGGRDGDRRTVDERPHATATAARAKRKESRVRLRGADADPGAARAGRAVDLPVRLPDPHEPVGGRADRRHLARLRRPRQLVAAVHRLGRRRELGAQRRVLHPHRRARDGPRDRDRAARPRAGVGQEHRALADPHADVHGAGDRRPARPLPDRLHLRALRVGAAGDRPLLRRHPRDARPPRSWR